MIATSLSASISSRFSNCYATHSPLADAHLLISKLGISFHWMYSADSDTINFPFKFWMTQMHDHPSFSAEIQMRLSSLRCRVFLIKNISFKSSERRCNKKWICKYKNNKKKVLFLQLYSQQWRWQQRNDSISCCYRLHRCLFCTKRIIYLASATHVYARTFFVCVCSLVFILWTGSDFIGAVRRMLMFMESSRGEYHGWKKRVHCERDHQNATKEKNKTKTTSEKNGVLKNGVQSRGSTLPERMRKERRRDLWRKSWFIQITPVEL